MIVKFLKQYWWQLFIWSIIIAGYFAVFVNKESVYKSTGYFIQTGFNVFVFYWNSNVLFVQFQKRKKLFLYFLLLIPVILTAAICKEIVTIALKIGFNYDFIHTFSFQSFFKSSVIAAFFLIVGLVFKVFLGYLENEKIKLKLRKEKNLAELNYLKSQINPHFLFNTLNNLYYLTLQKSDTAPEMVMKLSGLMRYIVTVAKLNSVLLQEELQNIANYMELEKLRLANPDCVHFKIEGELKNQQIAPLLLLPFLENAFKHSKERIEEGLWILIEINGLKLRMNVTNLYNENKVKPTTGSGLENVKRRLELLYPGNHDLQIIKRHENFEVELKINLYATTLYSN